MNFPGGFLPRIKGRPFGVVQDIPAPERLLIDLVSRDLVYTPSVASGQQVSMGESIASSKTSGGLLHLPAPASGTVTLHKEGSAPRIELTITRTEAPRQSPVDIKRTQADAMRALLARQGLWPLFWSSKTGGIPCIDGSERPRCIVVNCVSAEPFRARGSVILQRDWARIVQGLAALPRILEEYGTTCMTLTDVSNPIVQLMHKDLAGHAWIRFESVPLRYPIENPSVLHRSLLDASTSMGRGDTVWVTDVQTILQIGGVLADGYSTSRRILAIGGPGEQNPRHVCASVGTPLNKIIDERTAYAGNVILRGGLFTGEPVDWKNDSVRYDDDAFFVLPRPKDREFMSFVNPGFDRVSYTPCFATTITRAADRHITTSLRGEPRPCIGCANCEEVCPVGLLPQVLHRYLYRDAVDQVEAAGLKRCLLCGLCTFVCPSKIELQRQFADTKERLRKEHEAQAEAEAKLQQRESSSKTEAQHSEDWRK